MNTCCKKPIECCSKCWHIPTREDHSNGIYLGYCFNPACECHSKHEDYCEHRDDAWRGCICKDPISKEEKPDWRTEIGTRLLYAVNDITEKELKIAINTMEDFLLSEKKRWVEGVKAKVEAISIKNWDKRQDLERAEEVTNLVWEEIKPRVLDILSQEHE